MAGFERVEERNTQQMAQRAICSLNDRVASLHTLNHDWAAWDDT